MEDPKYIQYVERQIESNALLVASRAAVGSNRYLCCFVTQQHQLLRPPETNNHLLYRPLRLEVQRTCYHQTSPEAAVAIMESGRLLPGFNGRAGAGIYLTFDPVATFFKTLHPGVVLEVVVSVGKCMDCGRTPPTSAEVNLLLLDGYDSITYVTESGPEIVVYHPDQCRPVRAVE